mgnify:FL=1|tara:strand:- start:87 stop:509 length:423 start_codon:yes stop_codon:yes gene_type:complete
MKKLFGILVLGLLLSANVNAEIYDLKCVVVEQKFGDERKCSNCGQDDGLSIDVENKKILVSPHVEDITHSHLDENMIVEFSNKYIEWVLPLYQLEFKFNRNTYDLEFTKGRNIDFKTGKVTNPLAFFFKVKYKCKKIDKI